MVNTTVVDSLIVKLGLDPRDFTKGEKQAAAETVKLEQQVKKSSDGMGRSLAGFTGKLLGIATVAMVAKKVIGFTSELSTSIRQLGLDADNYNIAGSALRNFGNIAEMNGGKAEDATKTISGLNKAVYDMAYNGSMSESLIMLGRLGVRFQDTAGNMRDFKDIVMDTQSSIQGLMRNGTTRGSAFQMLKQAGFDDGLANAILQGDVGAQLARQQKRNQVTGTHIAAAKAWEESAANRSQSIDAAALPAMAKAATLGAATNNAIAEGIDSTGNGEYGQVFKNAVQGATEALKDFGHTLADMAEKSYLNSLPRGRAAYESTIQAAAKKNGLDPEVLAGILQTESNFNPRATSSTGRVGIAQLTPKYFPGAGKNPYADINTAAGELKRLKDKHLKAGNDDAAATYLALEDYNAGAKGASEMRSGKRPYTDETAAYPGKVLGYSSQATPTPGAQTGAGGGGRTEITFENVEVNSSGKDGQTLATDFVDATRRKMLASHADSGMQ